MQWLREETVKLYRLLSEAKWEYAARGGTTTRYCWEDDFDEQYANCNAPFTGKTSPVGSLPANPFGLSDMAGNVLEWMQDCWHNNYENAPDDGSVWEGGDESLRVLRGGSWFNEPRFLRSATRNGSYPVYRGGNVGFRLAQD